ncbi:MAG TPA: ribonuclease III [Candidatus Paceibacterota bacterium]|nr:ribonuclease III [Candidatus Paceibacterota bacterium]
MDFSQFEKNTGLAFKDKALLKQAFTHRSYLNENRNLKIEHNERLEFLGDAVLELVVTDYLFKKFSEKPEGELTSYRSSLVNYNILSEVAKELKMNDFLLLSRGEAKDTGRARTIILANAYEALVGAIYLDQGYEAARLFIAGGLFHLIDDIVRKGSFIDSKSLFQEKAQEKVGITPAYKTVREEGPDHDKHFTVGVFLDKDLVVEGTGKSKQEAEQEAARKALEKKGW